MNNIKHSILQLQVRKSIIHQKKMNSIMYDVYINPMDAINLALFLDVNEKSDDNYIKSLLQENYDLKEKLSKITNRGNDKRISVLICIIKPSVLLCKLCLILFFCCSYDYYIQVPMYCF